jgi:hypothetical protein
MAAKSRDEKNLPPTNMAAHHEAKQKARPNPPKTKMADFSGKVPEAKKLTD